MKNHAFTLAEVLITLGIIGVVAALTIPVLIANHKKEVVISKLKKASSTFSQAERFAYEKYGTSARETFDENDPEQAFEQFNMYYTPFLKISRIEKGDKGVFAYLEDGSAVYFRKTDHAPGWSNTYLFLCLTHKVCENFDESNRFYHQGKDVFTIYVNGSVPVWSLLNLDRNTLLNSCANNNSTEACSALIFYDGWKINDDYPIKL